MLFKIRIYWVAVEEYPGAKWRGEGKAQVYTGKINTRGKPDWEGAAGWFETREEAVEALRTRFANQVTQYTARLNEAKANWEKAKNL